MLARIAPRALVLAAMLALLAIFAGAPHPALARTDPEDGGNPKITRGTANFTLPANQCPVVAPNLTINGTGQQFIVTNTIRRPDGTPVTIVNATVTGTATDSNGGTYNFVYMNLDRNQPTGGGLIQEDMTDMFTLSGNGGANNYTVAFHWRWKFHSPADAWPPSIDWHKAYTLGDPITCDPL